MKKLIVAVCLLLVTATSGKAQWSMSEHGQLTPAGVASDSSGNRLLFCSPRNGYWLTENAGDSWIHINDRISDANLLKAGFAGLVTYAVAADPAADTLIINAITEEPHENLMEFHSFDGGMTWSQFNIEAFWPQDLLLMSGSDRVVFPRHRPGRVYYEKTTGFGISFGGDVWNVVDITDVSQGTQGVFFEQSRPDTIYIYGAYNGNEELLGGVIASYDGGWNWQQLTHMEDIFPGRGFIDDLVRIGPTSLLALNYSRDVDPYPLFIRTDNDGESWYPVYAEGLPPRMYAKRTLCSVHERPGRLLLGAIGNVGVWESNDYGLTWNRLLSGLPVNASSVLYIQRNEYSGHLYVSLLGQGLYRSVDYGDSWQLIPGPPCGIQSIKWRGITVFEGGVAQSSEWGYLWVAQGESTTLVQHEFPVYEDSWTAGYATALSEDEFVYVQNRHSYMGTDQVLTVRVSDLEGQDSVLLPQLELPNTPDYVIAVPNGDDTVYIGNDMGRYDIMVYENEITGWEQRPFGFFGIYLRVNEGDLYIFAEVEGEWMIGISTDLGISWEFIEFPVQIGHDLWSFQSKLLFNEDRMYVRIEDTCWVYSDGEWEMRGVISEEYDTWSMLQWEIIATDTELLIVAGSIMNHSMWLSSDGGWTWEDQPIELPEPYFSESTNQLEYDPWRDRLWIDTGVGLAYMDDPTAAVGEDVWVFQPATYATLSAYPNPFNSATTVRYSLTTPSEVRIRVYDLLGREVASLYDGLSQPGEHTLPFNAYNYPSGTYFLQLDTGNQVQTKRVTLIK